MNDATMRLLTLCAIRIDGKSLDWTLIARAGRDGHLDELWAGHPSASEPSQLRASTTALIRAAQGNGLADAKERVRQELEAGEQAGARLLTF